MTSEQVLIVEDEAIVALDLSHCISKLGYTIVGIVRSGEDAVEKAQSLHPDVVLMDIHLAGMMDGIEAAEMIRQLLDVPIIYLTAYADDDTVQRAILTQPFGYIRKPFEERDLQLAIEMALYKHKAEIALRTAKDELENRVKERTFQLAEKVNALEALHRIGVAMSSALDLPSLLNIVVQEAATLLSAKSCSILLPDDNTGEMVFKASIDPIVGMRIPPGQGIVSRVFREKTLQIINDVGTDPDYYNRIAQESSHYTHSMIAVPLLLDNNAIGVLEAINKQQGAFTPQDGELLMTMASHAAIEIENARLYDQLQEHAATLQIRVAQRTEELARSSELLSALSQVASQFETTSDYELVLKTIGLELANLGVSCFVILREAGYDQWVVKFISLESIIISRIQKLIGVKLSGFHVPINQYPMYQKLILERQTQYFADADTFAEKVLPGLSGHIRQKVIQICNLSPDVKAALFPLGTQEQVLGILALWGEGLQESYLPSFSIFAGQAANAINSARLYAETQRMALTDSLTEAYNRRGLSYLGGREIDRVVRFGHPLAIIMFDLDYFKIINDSHGHPIGDQVLIGLVKRCQKAIREVDILGRYGGEEFLVLMPETELDAAYQAAERLRRSIEEKPFPTDVGEISLTVSLGVTWTKYGTETLDTLIVQADKALYVAKQSGRNKVEFFD